MKNLILGMGLFLMLGCSHQEDVFRTHYSGTVELTEHVLGAKVAGRIATLLVQEGDVVKSGGIVATFDRFEQTKKDYERMQALLKAGGTNTQALEYAQLAMEDQQIISPIDGVVLVKSAEVGETVPAGAGIVVIGNTHEQWVKLFLPEGLIGQIRLGQPARIKLDGLAQEYAGRIRFIGTKAEFTPRNVQTREERVTQVFAVKVALDNPDEHVHSGVAADVRFL